MNEDAFARRFYADRAELESLRIQLTVDRPADAAAEQENYSLRSENFHLPAIEFTDEELAALQTALHLLDGEFAYAEPLRLALQQITWGRPSPLRAPEQQRSVALGHHGLGRRPRALGAPGEGRDGDLPPEDDHLRLLHDGARRAGRQARGSLPPAVPGRGVLPAGLRARARGDPRLPALAHPRQSGLRDEGRARLQAPRRTSTRAPTPTARSGSWASSGGSPRSCCPSGSRGRSSATSAATGRSSAVDGEERRPHLPHLLRGAADARLVGAGPGRARPPAGPAGAGRGARAAPGAAGGAPRREPAPGAPAAGAMARAPPSGGRSPTNGRRARRGASAAPTPGGLRGEELRRAWEAAIRPERFARLVTLAGILIEAGREGRRESLADLRERLQLSEEELREDIDVLNVVNFGGGSYVLYAEILDGGGRDRRGRPRALQRQLRSPRATAAGGGEGADRGDRPDRRAHPRGLADIRAREDRRRARGRPDGAGSAGGTRPQRRFRCGQAGIARRSSSTG